MSLACSNNPQWEVPHDSSFSSLSSHPAAGEAKRGQLCENQTIPLLSFSSFTLTHSLLLKHVLMHIFLLLWACMFTTFAKFFYCFVFYYWFIRALYICTLIELWYMLYTIIYKLETHGLQRCRYYFFSLGSGSAECECPVGHSDPAMLLLQNKALQIKWRVERKWRLNGYHHQVDIQISHQCLEPHENSMHHMPHE